ncbi:glycosyltransferase family 4 protein [Cytobacillus gottheilii]|uniref:glycosyltransferase family 4 protein n=1 Tax=Cytobacillus gottheilii TaxID=859144 RepID=UPI0009BB6C29|nr:glycosyltransferase family 4 protein [Cytobacillus gottheilii]
MDKVLFILNYTGDGGTEKYVLDLIRYYGPENCVFVYSQSGPGLKKFEETGTSIHQVDMKNPFDFKAAKRLKKIIADEQATIVHAQFLRENYISILAVLMGAKVNVIWTYHVDVPMGKNVRFLNRIVTRMNKKVIAVSHFMKDRLIEKGIPEQKIKVIYNGIDMPAHLDRHSMAITHDPPVITAIGRLRNEKGQDFLIDALAKIKLENPSLKWKCYLYGDGPEKDDLVNKVKLMKLEDYVSFKGYTTNKDLIYLNSDIIVVPSKNEALSYVAIEALAYSKLVIATDVGGLPEVIINGQTGYLVNYGDTEGLASKLSDVLMNKMNNQHIIENGYKHFMTHFESTKMMKDLSKVYKDK